MCKNKTRQMGESEGEKGGEGVGQVMLLAYDLKLIIFRGERKGEMVEWEGDKRQKRDRQKIEKVREKETDRDVKYSISFQ